MTGEGRLQLIFLDRTCFQFVQHLGCQTRRGERETFINYFNCGTHTCMLERPEAKFTCHMWPILLSFLPKQPRSGWERMWSGVKLLKVRGGRGVQLWMWVNLSTLDLYMGPPGPTLWHHLMAFTVRGEQICGVACLDHSSMLSYTILWYNCLIIKNTTQFEF